MGNVGSSVMGLDPWKGLGPGSILIYQYHDMKLDNVLDILGDVFTWFKKMHS